MLFCFTFSFFKATTFTLSKYFGYFLNNLSIHSLGHKIFFVPLSFLFLLIDYYFVFQSRLTIFLLGL